MERLNFNNMNRKEYKFLNNLIKKYNKSKDKKFYSLVGEPFTNEDIIAGIETLLSGRITMSSITKRFEENFAKFVGSKHALMVNSGSSANLLAFFSSINPKNYKRLYKNDECLIPAICWSTSLWPIVQAGLKPKFVDVSLDDFNFDLKKLEKKITKKTKAIMPVHLYGNSCNINELRELQKQSNFFIIEDAAQAHATSLLGQYVGNLGDLTCFSFYPTKNLGALGEAGAITTNNWFNYCATYNSSSGFVGYLNGVSVSTSSTTGTFGG